MAGFQRAAVSCLLGVLAYNPLSLVVLFCDWQNLLCPLLPLPQTQLQASFPWAGSPDSVSERVGLSLFYL